MHFFDLLTQPHQAILLVLWVGILFGFAFPGWRARMAATDPPASGFWLSIIWTIVVVVAFIAWLRLMIA